MLLPCFADVSGLLTFCWLVSVFAFYLLWSSSFFVMFFALLVLSPLILVYDKILQGWGMSLSVLRIYFPEFGFCGGSWLQHVAAMYKGIGVMQANILAK